MFPNSQPRWRVSPVSKSATQQAPPTGQKSATSHDSHHTDMRHAILRYKPQLGLIGYSGPWAAEWASEGVSTKVSGPGRPSAAASSAGPV